MARIAGINIPTNKRVEIALRYIMVLAPPKPKAFVKLSVFQLNVVYKICLTKKFFKSAKRLMLTTKLKVTCAVNMVKMSNA